MYGGGGGDWNGIYGLPYFYRGGYASGRAADEETGADERFLPAAFAVGYRAKVFFRRLDLVPVRAGGVGQGSGFELIAVNEVTAIKVVVVGVVTALEVVNVGVVTAFEVVGVGGNSCWLDGGAVDEGACGEQGEEDVDDAMHGLIFEYVT